MAVTPMLRSIFAKTMRDKTRSMIGWSAGVVALAGATIAVWPSVRNSELGDVMNDLPETLLAAFGISTDFDFLSPVGFVNGRVFAALAPLLLLMFAIGFGVRTLAGEEEEGTMDLLLSNPVPRRKVVLEKYAAMVLMTITIGAVLFTTVWLGSLAVDIDITVGGIFAASLAVTLLALFFGGLAMAIGAATGRRALSLGIATTIAVATYFLWSLSPLVDFLDTIKGVSPWYYAQDDVPLANGLPVLRAAVLVVGAAVFAWLAVTAFERRDIGT